MNSRKALIDYVIGNEFISKPELQQKFINLLNKHEQSLQLQQGGVVRSIYEYFTDAEIGLFAHLVKEHSKANGHSEYKQGKLDKLEAKLKQLRSF